jgi:hypothetical protein
MLIKVKLTVRQLIFQITHYLKNSKENVENN